VAAERLALPDAGAAAELAARIRGPAAPADAVSEAVTGIVAAVRERGDEALRELVERFDEVCGAPLAVPAGELRAALDGVDPDVRAGLEVAIANVRAVAEAGVGGDAAVDLPQGQRVLLREVQVRRAAIYAP
jgi:histidinol dehydrogenase